MPPKKATKRATPDAAAKATSSVKRGKVVIATLPHPDDDSSSSSSSSSVEPQPTEPNSLWLRFDDVGNWDEYERLVRLATLGDAGVRAVYNLDDNAVVEYRTQYAVKIALSEHKLKKWSATCTPLPGPPEYLSKWEVGVDENVDIKFDEVHGSAAASKQSTIIWGGISYRFEPRYQEKGMRLFLNVPHTEKEFTTPEQLRKFLALGEHVLATYAEIGKGNLEKDLIKATTTYDDNVWNAWSDALGPLMHSKTFNVEV